MRESLLWEYDLESFNYQQMRNIVVQRVVERGRMDDFYAILNLYGVEGVKNAIREIDHFHPKDLAFVCSVFDLQKEELTCCTRKQSHPQRWNC